MLLDFGGIDGAWQQAWKCLGCGRELLVDVERQAEDDLAKEGVVREQDSLIEARRRRAARGRGTSLSAS